METSIATVDHYESDLEITLEKNIKNANITTVIKAIETLSPNYQDVLILFYYLELTLQECADILEIKKETFRKRKSTALSALAKELEERGLPLKNKDDNLRNSLKFPLKRVAEERAENITPIAPSKNLDVEIKNLIDPPRKRTRMIQMPLKRLVLAAISLSTVFLFVGWAVLPPLYGATAIEYEAHIDYVFAAYGIHTHFRIYSQRIYTTCDLCYR